MKIDILTLFPEMFENIFSTSIIKRAIDEKKVEINIHNFRDYTNDPHNKVDDTPFGGGAGMVLSIQPIYDALEDIKTEDSYIILLTPGGKVFNQKMAVDFSSKKHIILICGHYEGFDDRIRNFIDLELSIGDYVLTGGEVPSMVVVDSIVRLIPGVITDDSLKCESFNDGLLDYPVYTKPREFMGYSVPDVLLSGDHKKIDEYREKERIKRTEENRRDLLEK